jgi:hypothetical protein
MPADSPNATTSAKGFPDPYEQPIDYLKAKGWKHLGLPNHPNTVWLDPSKPLEDRWLSEPIMIKIEREIEINGTPTGKTEIREEQLNYHMGRGNRTDKKPRERTVFIPKVQPVSLSEALQIQLHMDRLELMNSGSIAAKRKAG